jgi:hypothetical protein
LRKGGGTPSAIGAADLERLIGRFGDPTANELTVEFTAADLVVSACTFRA